MFDKFFRYIVTLDSSQADQRINQFETRAGTIGSTVGRNLKEVIALGGKTIAFGYSMKKAFDFGLEGAKTNQLRDSFQRMNKEIFQTPDLLERMKESSRGTISEIDLMQYAMLLTIGSTDELARSMAQALPKIVEIAKASAKLNPTLGDMNYLFQSITTGIKRNSPLFLDNAGLIISSERANKLYAEALGKTADQLSETEQKQALLNEVIKQGEVIIRQAGGSLESTADKYDAFAIHLGEVWEGIKGGIDYLISPVIDNLNERFERLNNFGSGDSPLMDWLRGQWQELKSINEELERMIGLNRKADPKIQLNDINNPFGGYNIPGFNLIGGYSKDKKKDDSIVKDQISLIDSATKKVDELEKKYKTAVSESELKKYGDQLKKAKKELDRLMGYSSTESGNVKTPNIISTSDYFKEFDEISKKSEKEIEAQSFAYVESRKDAQKELDDFIRTSNADMIHDEYQRRIAQAKVEAEELEEIYRGYLENNFLTQAEFEEAQNQIRQKNIFDIYEIEKDKAEELAEKRLEKYDKEAKRVEKLVSIISREFSKTGNKFIDDLVEGLNVAIEIARTLSDINSSGGNGSGILGLLSGIFSIAGLFATGGASAMTSGPALLPIMHDGGIVGKKGLRNDESRFIGKYGEMVLNQGDQSNLLAMIKSGGSGSTQPMYVVMQVDSKNIMTQVIEPELNSTVKDLSRRRIWSF